MGSGLLGMSGWWQNSPYQSFGHGQDFGLCLDSFANVGELTGNEKLNQISGSQIFGRASLG